MPADFKNQGFLGGLEQLLGDIGRGVLDPKYFEKQRQLEQGQQFAQQAAPMFGQQITPEQTQALGMLTPEQQGNLFVKMQELSAAQALAEQRAAEKTAEITRKEYEFEKTYGREVTKEEAVESRFKRQLSQSLALANKRIEQTTGKAAKPTPLDLIQQGIESNELPMNATAEHVRGFLMGKGFATPNQGAVDALTEILQEKGKLTKPSLGFWKSIGNLLGTVARIEEPIFKPTPIFKPPATKQTPPPGPPPTPTPTPTPTPDLIPPPKPGYLRIQAIDSATGKLAIKYITADKRAAALATPGVEVLD